MIKWTAGVALTLFLIIFLTASWFMNQEPVRKRIRHALERHAGTVVQYERLNFTLLPRPHVTLTKAAVTVSGKLHAALPEARIYAEWLPLFNGNIRIAKVRLDNPDVTVAVSEEPGVRNAEEGPAPFMETEEIESGMASIREIAPRLEGIINKGRLIILRDGAEVSHLRNITGSIVLLRKGFDISVTADAPRWGPVAFKGALFVIRNTIVVKELSASGGNSSLSGLTARLSWKRTPYLVIRSGRGTIDLNHIYERRRFFENRGKKLRDIKQLKGTLRLTAMNFKGPLLHPERWKMETTGALEKVLINAPFLPGPARITRGEFKTTMNAVSLKNIRGKILDASVTASITLAGVFDTIRSVDLFLAGDVGPESMHWAARTFDWPPDYIIRAPLWLSDLRLTWKKGVMFSVAGTAALQNGPSVSIDLQRTGDELLIRRLTVQDEKTRATLTAGSSENILELTFNGKMSEDTLRRVFERGTFDHGWVRGDFRARILFKNPAQSRAQGFLEAVDTLVPVKPSPLAVRHIVLSAEKETITVKKGSFTWMDAPFDLNGRVTAALEGFFVDMDVVAENLSREMLQRAFPRRSDGKEPGKKSARGRLPILGLLRVSAKNFFVGRYAFTPVRADVFLDRNSTRIHITETSLCGIAVPGHLRPFDQYLLLDLNPSASNQPLEPALKCLSADKRITGAYTLTGKVHAKGKGREMLSSLQGRLEFAAKDGKIYHYPLLARLFAFLNLTELLRGSLPDLGRDGFAYSSIKIKGDMSNGRLILQEAALEGATLNIAGEGEINFVSNTMDVTLLIAPFKTLEYIISRIPLLRNVLSNKLATIPVRIAGDMHDPDVIPLDPQAIGQNLLNIMKEILALPFRIIDPFID